MFKKIFPPSRVKKLKKELERHQKAIQLYLDYAHSTPSAVEYCTVSKQPCRSSGLLMWVKDINHKYTFANMRHCNDFYHLPLIKVKTMIGKTDAELVQRFRERTGLRHTFGELCVGTDAYIIEKLKTVRFWEMGYINGDIMILDVTKKPEYNDDGEVIGTSGWAHNVSDRECEIKALLAMYLRTKEAIPLEVMKEKKVASYIIKKQLNPFNGDFPL